MMRWEESEMRPIVRGLYLAGRVDVDAFTRNLTLVNCFRSFRLPTLPGVAQPFCLVAYLVNGFGDTRVEARVYRLDTFDEVYRAVTDIRFADRLTEIRYVLRVEQCRFPTPGLYQAELYANHELIAATPFHVLTRTESA
jgi:hypothetical protein